MQAASLASLAPCAPKPLQGQYNARYQSLAREHARLQKCLLKSLRRALQSLRRHRENLSRFASKTKCGNTAVPTGFVISKCIVFLLQSNCTNVHLRLLILCLRYLANAEDAEATKFVVAVDKSSYPTANLPGETMAPLQQAALLFGNDRELTELDIDNLINNVGNSRKAENCQKIGNFGCGVLVAYGVTDVIQLASGDKLRFIDPQQACLPILPGQLHTSISSSLRHADKAAESNNFIVNGPDVLRPFTAFTRDCESLPGLVAKNHFSGTLFRLALRTVTCQHSHPIASAPFTLGSALQLLQSVNISAAEMLLFTKHVQQIQVMVKETESSPAVVLHSCQRMANSAPAQPNMMLYTQDVSVQTQHDDCSLDVKHWMLTIHNTTAGETAGVAILLAEDHRLGHKLPPIDGKIFCTLPTMLRGTGLKIHINARFRMGANKRQLYEGPGHRGKVCSDRLHAGHLSPCAT